MRDKQHKMDQMWLQAMLSARRATIACLQVVRRSNISILALREEGDSKGVQWDCVKIVENDKMVLFIPVNRKNGSLEVP